MIFKHKLKAALVTLAAIFILGCSPTKKVSRIIDRHPEAFTELVDTLYLPEVKIDTFFSIDTEFIASDLDSIFITVSDSCREEIDAIIPSISHYIATRYIISDTLYYSSTIENDSLILTLNAKIWQDGTKIHLNVVLSDSKAKYKTIEVKHVPKEKFSFGQKLRVFFFYLGAVALILFLFRRLRK